MNKNRAFVKIITTILIVSNIIIAVQLIQSKRTITNYQHETSEYTNQVVYRIFSSIPYMQEYTLKLMDDKILTAQEYSHLLTSVYLWHNTVNMLSSYASSASENAGWHQIENYKHRTISLQIGSFYDISSKMII